MNNPESKTTVLSPRARKAMREALEVDRRGSSMGTRKIVSMQECEDAGLVRRIRGSNGLIADWELTQAGREWQGQ